MVVRGLITHLFKRFKRSKMNKELKLNLNPKGKDEWLVAAEFAEWVAEQHYTVYNVDTNPRNLTWNNGEGEHPTTQDLLSRFIKEEMTEVVWIE